MGNTPSTTQNARPSAASQSPSPSPSPSSHEPRHRSVRGDPRNLTQRTAAAAAPSTVQARGSNVTHRTRSSQSSPAAAAYLNHPSPSQSLNSSSAQSDGYQLGIQQTQTREEPKVEMRDQPSKPVDVPIPSSNHNESNSLRSHSMSMSLEPSGPPLTQDMAYHLTRPPRLPLPIEEEVHTPGSPIIAPADADIDAPALDIEALDNDTLPRRSSALSNTTLDEEDAEELRVDKTKATVPTPLEWREGGDKVYVTGTIFSWNKKQRLHPVEGEPGVLRAIVHVRPGTHHVRFIVDNVMTCSTNLPTTVDFGNNLVNYIEVSADDLPRDVADPPEVTGEFPAQKQKGPAEAEPKPAEEEAKAVKPSRTRPAIPATRYTSQVPQYLIDLDKDETSSAYQYAAAAIEKLPSAPSLPGFLGKPILNAATPMKDDNSVLTMPNHTVLNHLATSSIKNNVLAVSVTTRYKKKYVTTIMYKPTAED